MSHDSGLFIVGSEHLARSPKYQGKRTLTWDDLETRLASFFPQLRFATADETLDEMWLVRTKMRVTHPHFLRTKQELLILDFFAFHRWQNEDVNLSRKALNPHFYGDHIQKKYGRLLQMNHVVEQNLFSRGLVHPSRRWVHFAHAVEALDRKRCLDLFHLGENETICVVGLWDVMSAKGQLMLHIVKKLKKLGLHIEWEHPLLDLPIHFTETSLGAESFFSVEPLEWLAKQIESALGEPLSYDLRGSMLGQAMYSNAKTSTISLYVANSRRSQARYAIFLVKKALSSGFLPSEIAIFYHTLETKKELRVAAIEAQLNLQNETFCPIDDSRFVQDVVSLIKCILHAFNAPLLFSTLRSFWDASSFRPIETWLFQNKKPYLWADEALFDAPFSNQKTFDEIRFEKTGVTLTEKLTKLAHLFRQLRLAENPLKAVSTFRELLQCLEWQAFSSEGGLAGANKSSALSSMFFETSINHCLDQKTLAKRYAFLDEHRGSLSLEKLLHDLEVHDQKHFTDGDGPDQVHEQKRTDPSSVPASSQERDGAINLEGWERWEGLSHPMHIEMMPAFSLLERLQIHLSQPIFCEAPPSAPAAAPAPIIIHDEMLRENASYTYLIVLDQSEPMLEVAPFFPQEKRMGLEALSLAALQLATAHAKEMVFISTPIAENGHPKDAPFYRPVYRSLMKKYAIRPLPEVALSEQNEPASSFHRAKNEHFRQEFHLKRDGSKEGEAAFFCSKEHLGQKTPSATHLTLSTLETYASCMFKGLAHHLFRLKEKKWTNSLPNVMDEGRLVHLLLDAMVSAGTDLWPLRPRPHQTLRMRAADRVAKIRDEFSVDLSYDAISPPFRDSFFSWCEHKANLLFELTLFDLAWDPILTEQSFGSELSVPPFAQPKKRGDKLWPPLLFRVEEDMKGGARHDDLDVRKGERGDTTFFLSGRIDRVDLSSDRLSVRVIDYKRSEINKNDIGRTALQVPLYAKHAVDQLAPISASISKPSEPSRHSEHSQHSQHEHSSWPYAEIPKQAKTKLRVEGSYLSLKEAYAALFFRNQPSEHGDEFSFELKMKISEEEIKKSESKTLSLLRSLKKGEFLPLPAKEGSCDDCSYDGLCRRPHFAPHIKPHEEEDEHP